MADAPPSPATVRRAGPDDAAALARLRWTWSEEGHAPIAGSRDEYADGLRDWMTAHPSIVPFLGSVGGQDVGMAWLVLVPRVPDPRSFDRLTGDIQSVYVLPDHRDAGLGARLVDAALAHARGAGCFRVTV
ncbi:GNAT family N-acetyltransferase, partial [Phycicoccus flavus]